MCMADGAQKWENEFYIMKRLRMDKGEHIVLSGLREMYFGELFQKQIQQDAGASFHTSEENSHLVCESLSWLRHQHKHL